MMGLSKTLVRWLLAAAPFVVIACVILSARDPVGAAVTTWQTTTLYSPPFQVWDTVRTYYVADTAGTVLAMTKTHYRTPDNVEYLRAVPSYYTGGDTLGQGSYCEQVGSSTSWRIRNPEFAPYDIYACSGDSGATDTLVTRLQGWPVIGHNFPDSSVTANAIQSAAFDSTTLARLVVPYAITRALVDTTDIVTFHIAEPAAPGGGKVGIWTTVPLGPRATVDSLLADALVRVGGSGVIGKLDLYGSDSRICRIESDTMAAATTIIIQPAEIANGELLQATVASDTIRIAGSSAGAGDVTGVAQGTGMTITNGGGPVPTIAFRATYGDSNYVQTPDRMFQGTVTGGGHKRYGFYVAGCTSSWIAVATSVDDPDDGFVSGVAANVWCKTDSVVVTKTPAFLDGQVFNIHAAPPR